LILDKEALKSRNPARVAREALSGGADIVQIRDKRSSIKEIISYGKSIKKETSKKNALLIVNDRVDACKALNADGVHLGQDDMPIKEARSILGNKKIVGASCRNTKQAINAKKEGADYIALGPIFKSPTKPELHVRGLGLLKRVSKRIESPIVAIGGIDEAHASCVMESGADTIAVASAVLNRRDIKKATHRFKKILDRSK